MKTALPLLFLLAPTAAALPHDPHHGHHGHHERHGDHEHPVAHTHAQRPGGARSIESLVTDAKELIEAATANPSFVRHEFQHAFDDPRRRTIDFFPLVARKDQRGLRLGLMGMEQRRATHRLLRGVLSEEGYLRAQAIRGLESTLRESVVNSSYTRVPDAYTVQFFGEPRLDAPWAFKFEGHHLSVNATLVDGRFRGTPLFLGVNPAEVHTGPDAGLRVLAPQEDLARALLHRLTDEQRARAVVPAYDPKLAIPLGALVDPDRETGLSANEMTEAQQVLLVQLITSYARHLRPSFAEEELARLEAAGIGSLKFLWRGGTRPGEPFSYVVHGPTVVLQMDAVVDVPGQPANHLHALWRDPERDFGDDLLARHHREDHR